MSWTGFDESWFQEEMRKKAARLERDLAGVPVPEKVVAHPTRKQRMNKTEARYAEQFLEPAKRAGHILDYQFEAIKLRLADNTWYSPDFLVTERDYTQSIHEVKGGFVREDAWVKLKVIAELYPQFAVQKCQEVKGKWTISYVGR